MLAPAREARDALNVLSAQFQRLLVVSEPGSVLHLILAFNYCPQRSGSGRNLQRLSLLDISAQVIRHLGPGSPDLNLTMSLPSVPDR